MLYLREGLKKIAARRAETMKKKKRLCKGGSLFEF